MTEELIITREFDAPRQLVFEAFTQAEHLKEWWGPAGSNLEVLALDVKPGGKFHYKSTYPGGQTIFGLFRYKEINAPDKIVFVSSFSDAEGNIGKIPFDITFPLEVLNTWTFTETNGKTQIRLHGVPLTTVDAEKQGFADLHASMNEGFNKTFDQLEAYIRARFKLISELKTSRMQRTSTYLNFPGNTEEAFTFYKQVFRSEFSGSGIKRFGEIPPIEGHPSISEEDKKLVLHIELPILGGHVLMATDAPASMGFTVTTGTNMYINLEPDSREETKRLFDALSESGNITMPLQDMFWGAYYGSCTDRYGINWMFNFTNN